MLTTQSSGRRLVLVFAWAVILLISDLPNVLLDAFIGQAPAWLFWAKVGVLGAGLALCLLWKPIHPLWQFMLVFLVFYLALAASDWIGASPFWQARFEVPSSAEHSWSNFTLGYLGFHLRDLGVALAVIAALFFVKRSWSAFYLVKGHMDASIQPVRWLGIKQGESWRLFGWIFTACAGAIIFFVVLLSTPLSADILQRAAPYFPLAILLSAVNAFAEESYYRLSMLSTLRDLVGDNQALLLNVVFFGLAHYLVGSPPGILGAALTGFLAFLMGKSILETRGVLWAWIIHFVPDVFIFASYALVWVGN